MESWKTISRERAAAYKAAAPAYKAAGGEGSPGNIRIIFDFWKNKRLTPMDERGNTILHLLSKHGNTEALKVVLENIDGPPPTSEELRTSNTIGDTPLHQAAMFGHKEALQILLDQDVDLVLAQNQLGETPIYIAAACGKQDVYNLLTTEVLGRRNPPTAEVLLARKDGRTILHAAIMEEHYCLALSIMKSFPYLAEDYGMSALDILATKPTSFYSGSSYALRNLGSWPFIPLQIFGILTYHCIASAEDPPQNGLIFKSRAVLATKLISCCPYIRGIESLKQKHTFALVLARLLVEKSKDWIPSYLAMLLIEATKNGIIELVKEILEKCPYAACAIDENGKNILHIAVEKKDGILYNYFTQKTFGIRDMLTEVDNKGNTVLHLAACLGANSKSVHGNLNQMTWDICWFKRVSCDTRESCLHTLNNDKKTAHDVFKENHQNLERESEKEIKEMNNGLMLVSALIGTVSYAALFTVPGGFDQDKQDKTEYGLPILLMKDTQTARELKLFMLYICLTLLSSLWALGTMLSIQLSRFRTNDFYMALPFRFLVAMIALFCSVNCTALACLQAYTLENISFFPYWELTLFVLAYTTMIVFFFDTVYLNLYCMYIALYYSLRYNGPEVLALLV